MFRKISIAEGKMVEKKKRQSIGLGRKEENLYIGEIVASWADESCMTEGKLDIQKLNPLLLTMPDNRYWTVGAFVGNAWEAGKGLEQG
jgi:flavin reductase (DIM6/NTAB) family NADH-FMN oxidoreductase RutF